MGELYQVACCFSHQTCVTSGDLPPIIVPPQELELLAHSSKRITVYVFLTIHDVPPENRSKFSVRLGLRI
jgi:hypothetical protein